MLMRIETVARALLIVERRPRHSLYGLIKTKDITSNCGAARRTAALYAVEFNNFLRIVKQDWKQQIADQTIAQSHADEMFYWL